MTFTHPDAVRIEGDEARRQRDRDNLAALLAAPPEQIVVVSDLHLGRGVLRDGDRTTSKENFFADHAFRRLLGFWADHGRNGPGLLVLLGDTVDFVRHDEAPDADALDSDDLLFWRDRLDEIDIQVRVDELQRSISRVERLYGLRTDPIKSVYKLADTARGHPEFFLGLAEWVVRGGRILVVRGNHDLEWHWLAVRASLRSEIRRAVSFEPTPIDVEQQVLFADDLGVSIGNLYFEHGHEFDSMTGVGENPNVLPHQPFELTYPLGSFINRYLINPIEHIDPFLDNVKPVQNAVLAVIQRYPLKSLGIAWRGIRFLSRALSVGGLRGGLYALATILLALAPTVTIVLVVLALAIPDFGRALVGLLGRGAAPAGILGLAAPYLWAAAKEFFADYIRPPKTIDRTAFPRREATLLALPGPRSYLVLGHTHRLDSRVILRENQRVIHFINTGSWTPSWSGQPRNQREGTVHPVVVFRHGAGGFSHGYYEWDDARGAPIPAVMLDRA